MVKVLLCALVMFLSFGMVGCGNTAELDALKKENSELKAQIETLEKEKTEMENKIAMYVPKEQSVSKSDSPSGDQPVKLAGIEIGPDAGGASVQVNLQNASGKNVDAIEFVVLQFDNFGRPSNRFNDESYGNVTNPLTLQGNAAPGSSLKGSWTLFNMEKSRKAKVVIKQVHFTDGAIWENKNFEAEVEKEKGQY